MSEAIFEYRYVSDDGNSISVNKSALIKAYHLKACQELSTSEHECIVTADFKFDAIFLPLLGIIGIVGNIFGILCFSKQLHLTYNTLMFSLAISDLVTIISFVVYNSLPLWISNYIILENPIFSYLFFWSYITCHISQLVAIYTLISLSIERYYSTCRPLAYRKHQISVYYYLIPTIIFSCTYCIPIYFESSIKDVSLEKYQINRNNTVFLGNSTVYQIKHTDLKVCDRNYKIFYVIASKLVVKCIVPYIMLISTNVIIVRKLYQFDYTIRRKQIYQIDCEHIEERKRTSELRLHTNARGVNLRESQKILGIVNLAITLAFLVCYSIPGGVIYDFQYLLSPSATEVRMISVRSILIYWIIVIMLIFYNIFLIIILINFSRLEKIRQTKIRTQRGSILLKTSPKFYYYSSAQFIIFFINWSSWYRKVNALLGLICKTIRIARNECNYSLQFQQKENQKRRKEEFKV